MRTKLLFALVVAALVFGAGPATAEMKGEINLFLGQKILSEDEVDDLEPFIDGDNMDVGSPSEYGIGVSFGNPDWPVMIAVDLLIAEEDDSTRAEYYYGFATEKVEVETTELNLGVRKFWTNKEKVHPYVGGGLAYIKADVKDIAKLFAENGIPGLKQTQIDEAVLVDDDDSGIGFWANAGVLFRLNDKFSLGLDVRYSDADAEFQEPEFLRGKQEGPSDFKFDTGGVHYGIMFGYRW